MSESLDRIAEITKLARLLGVEAKDLGYLEIVPSVELTQFRARCTDTMFDGDSGRLHRVVAASKLVPVGLTVRISQLAFGPVLCAATVGLLNPSHAVKIASKDPTSFLSDIAVHLDPRRAAEVISVIPAEIVVRVAVELIRRGELRHGGQVREVPSAGDPARRGASHRGRGGPTRGLSRGFSTPAHRI